MEITFAPREILQIDDAQLMWRNFAGRGTDMNREGDRNFHILIEEREMTAYEKQSFIEVYREFTLEDGVVVGPNGEEIIFIHEALEVAGWAVKRKVSRTNPDDYYFCLKVNVNYRSKRGIPPVAWLISGRAENELFEDTIHRLDEVTILTAHVDINPSDWTMNGKSGRSAYLRGIEVHQEVDRFSARRNRMLED